MSPPVRAVHPKVVWAREWQKVLLSKTPVGPLRCLAAEVSGTALGWLSKYGIVTSLDSNLEYHSLFKGRAERPPPTARKDAEAGQGGLIFP